MTLFDSISGWHWLALAVAMLPIQAITARVLVVLVIGALAVALAMSITPIGLQAQLILFTAVTAAACIGYWAASRPHNARNATAKLKRRKAHLLGVRASLMSPIKGGHGKVQIKDALWTVTCGQDLPAGTVVEVSGYDRDVLYVSKISG